MAARGLTPKQAAFVAEYLVDLNATQAAIRAGYSEKSAARIGVELLNKTQVREAVVSAQAQRAERVEITADYVLSNLQEIVERSMQRAPVLDLKGRQVQDAEGRDLWQFDAKNANRSLELLGKHLGMWRDRLELSGGVDVTVLEEARRRAAR